MLMEKQNKNKSGPVANKQGIPYDYIVIVDAGSKGSRVFVYNWLNPAEALRNGFDLNEPKRFQDFKLVKRVEVKEGQGNHQDRSKDDDEDDDTDDDEDDEDGGDDNAKDDENDDDKNKNKDDKHKDEDNKKTKTAAKKVLSKLPKVSTKKKWKTKIKPGIATFNNSPQKIGNHHLKHLLTLAGQIVPKSQHYRTPIFLHSTAGMRLLTPPEQQKILNHICEYFTTESDFFLPDCPSHVNVIEGDIEGIYGWLAINSLVGTFDNPASHQHGKNHTTYGLLDMGGASTQVVFQPNMTEIDEHKNNLYNINLFELPRLNSDSNFDSNSGETSLEDGEYIAPKPLNFKVYSDSFLGLGMSQAYSRYLSSLVASNSDDSAFFYSPPITDPCLPKGYRTEAPVNGDSHDFTGDSNFEKCLTSIFPVLTQSSYGTAAQASGNCKQYNEGNKVSSCLLNDLIPAFDFDINHFFGVSGYWYAISNLMAYNEPAPSHLTSRKTQDSDYDYKIIYENTQKLCSKSYTELIEMNERKPEKYQMSMDELTNLCFKSSWILNFLHLGLGFPRFGIDDVDQAQKDKFKSLQLVDKVNGAEFSWTFGRALLYSNDEYVKAFNNYTAESNTKQKLKDSSKLKRATRAGFTFSVSPNMFHYGSEQAGVASRPKFTPVDPNAEYRYFDYELYEGDNTYTELKWYIEPHRWYGIVIFGLLLSFIFWLLLGKQGRLKITGWAKDIVNKFRVLIYNVTHRNEYVKVDDLEGGAEEIMQGYEMNDLRPEDQKNEQHSQQA